jgi:hypothetical protein
MMNYTFTTIIIQFFNRPNDITTTAIAENENLDDEGQHWRGAERTKENQHNAIVTIGYSQFEGKWWELKGVVELATQTTRSPAKTKRQYIADFKSQLVVTMEEKALDSWCRKKKTRKEIEKILSTTKSKKWHNDVPRSGLSNYWDGSIAQVLIESFLQSRRILQWHRPDTMKCRGSKHHTYLEQRAMPLMTLATRTYTKGRSQPLAYWKLW